MLHHPAYRASYEINLKREFPRLPFYGDFRQWAKWGRALMELHLEYEQAAPFALQRHDRKDAVGRRQDYQDSQDSQDSLDSLDSLDLSGENPVHPLNPVKKSAASAKPALKPKPKLKADKGV